MYTCDVISKYKKVEAIASTMWEVDVTDELVVARKNSCEEDAKTVLTSSTSMLAKKNVGKFSPVDRNKLAVEVKNFRYLPDNWDGYGAKSISSDVVFYAIYFLRIIPNVIPLPMLDISADNEIIFSWEYERSSLDISFENSGNVRCYTRHRKGNGEISHIHKKISIDTVTQVFVSKMLGVR